MNKKKLNDQILEFLELSDINALIEKAGEKLGAGLAFRYDDSSRTITRSSSYEFLNNAKSFPLNEIERLYDTRRIIDGSQSCGVLILDRRPPGKNDFLVDALIIGLRFLFRREKTKKTTKILLFLAFSKTLFSTECLLNKRIANEPSCSAYPPTRKFCFLSSTACLLRSAISS